MKTLLILLLTLSLNAAGFWTLTGVTKANIYVKNELSMVNPNTIVKIKEKMNKMLKENGILTAQQDSPTLMIALEEISNDDAYYVYVTLALGEEVQTFRDDKSATFALTYDANDFLETDEEELDSEVLESVDFLLAQFSEQFEDDKE